jgi:radical SAM superfamily enzyme YgiQ (UPF0313 family)
MTGGRRIALVCMTPATDTAEGGAREMPSYGIRRIQAMLVADPAFDGFEIKLIDQQRPDVESFVEAIEAFQPDLIGMSVYIWSTPCLVAVARRIKSHRPGTMIVFGGPSARTAQFDLPPYAGPESYLDALVPTEGEITFREIAALPELTRGGLESVAGLDLPARDGWARTRPRPLIANLDQIASPFQLGLMPDATVAYLETYRGCPLSCRFCEWGATESAKTVFSADYVAREFEAYAKNDIHNVFLVDAGLNLNAKGFRSLQEAQSRTNYLQTVGFWSEVYPSHLREEHVEFLSSVGAGYLGVGLQSLDQAVLEGLERRFDQRRFETVIRQLDDVAMVELQIIFGLPGESPEGFRRTLDYARSLPGSVRAYHCLVLPDALMTRGRPEWDIRFDPVTLELLSCQGWSVDQVQEMRTELTQSALAAGGTAGNYWWFFP